MAVRKSSRVKHNEKKGVTPAKFRCAHADVLNSFSVLNVMSNDDLLEIARESDVILGGDIIESTNIISAMRAEEEARAALAKANYKAHLAERQTDLHSLEHENLELGCISNSHQGYAMKKIGVKI